MHYIQIDKPGHYDALRLIQAPDRRPKPGELLIAVEACGVNYADGIIRMGLYESARKLHGYPITPGFEVAGRVLALGDGVEGWEPGDAVLALTLFGGYSSQLCLPPDRVFRIPPGLDMPQAAALPCVFLTAWWMAQLLLQPRAGDRWLVHSAAGGVGGALAQLGKLAGCQVTGVVGSAHKVEAALAAGCESVIDKSTQALWKSARKLAPDGFQAVFDANGVATLQQSYEHLAAPGALLIYGFASMLPRDGRLNWLRLAWDWLRTPRFNPLTLTRDNKSVLACNLSFLESQGERMREGMDWLLQAFADGRLRPPTVRTYPLAQAAAAQQAIESGSTAGKLVLLP